MDDQSYWSGRNLSFSEDSRIQVGISKVGHFMGKFSFFELQAGKVNYQQQTYVPVFIYLLYLLCTNYSAEWRLEGRDIYHFSFFFEFYLAG